MKNFDIFRKELNTNLKENITSIFTIDDINKAIDKAVISTHKVITESRQQQIKDKYENINVDSKLKNFLLQENLWIEFCDNLIMIHPDTYDRGVGEGINTLGAAFEWAKSKEGFKFWSKLNEKI